MNLNDVTPGLRIRTTTLGDTRGMMIRQDYLNNRTAGISGTVKNFVPGHGGDAWWVQHDDGGIAAYVFDEFEPLPVDAAPCSVEAGDGR